VFGEDTSSSATFTSIVPGGAILSKPDKGDTVMASYTMTSGTGQVDVGINTTTEITGTKTNTVTCTPTG
jgi:hypothetical protein